MEQNEIGEDLVDPKNPLGFVTENRDADSVIEAAYRFCSRQTGVDLVLVGTGSKSICLRMSTRLMALRYPFKSWNELMLFLGTLARFPETRVAALWRFRKSKWLSS